MTEIKVFDPTPLLELAEDTSNATMKAFVQGYLHDLPGKVERLMQAVSAGDTAQTTLVAHDLKGSSAGIGAQQLAKMAMQMETSARSGQLMAVNVVMKRLPPVLELTTAAVSEWLASVS
ncbi:Hpt domain-containing protein [Pokkaliibacter sp. MBI-7]|uniref:Hpt domain-containing protein n=1 Tax=Pokkaliibacter sp. MBI-7 TaxID=3040600 RepID=UPI00244BE017|nr:Hpt domain-containing protein [Pokkaliibacter sp. MBI-7]MDH2436432.1 Hpt domain-containing protein [Pokkaliibacter sp. MBI-7]